MTTNFDESPPNFWECGTADMLVGNAVVLFPQPVATAPWVSSHYEKGTPTEQTSKTVEWYRPTLKILSAVTVEVAFMTYVGLLSEEEEVEEQIYPLRAEAWDVVSHDRISMPSTRLLHFSCLSIYMFTPTIYSLFHDTDSPAPIPSDDKYDLRSLPCPCIGALASLSILALISCPSTRLLYRAFAAANPSSTLAADLGQDLRKAAFDAGASANCPGAVAESYGIS